jgi:hypothetical protein
MNGFIYHLVTGKLSAINSVKISNSNDTLLLDDANSILDVFRNVTINGKPMEAQQRQWGVNRKNDGTIFFSFLVVLLKKGSRKC